ncbi:MAG: hypothetical protein AB1593_11635 [Pseudomonadota bacterium]
MRIAVVLFLGWAASAGYSAPLAAPADPGRLFYTPAQRAQLESTRARGTRPAPTDGPARQTVPPLRYDGVVIRSDGRTTRWVDGRPQVGPSGVAGLKPGQVRAGGKIYEPYQVLPPPSPPTQENAP